MSDRPRLLPHVLRRDHLPPWLPVQNPWPRPCGPAPASSNTNAPGATLRAPRPSNAGLPRPRC
eukprot:3743936-Lingulodinium_polyedra.AAC.1